MANRGNTGYFYKWSTVTTVNAQDNAVIVELACGHKQTWYPFSPETAEEWAASIIAGTSSYATIGQTKMRCTQQHD